MRAATLVAPRRFEIRHHDPPSPGRDDVVLAVRGCGLCASNLGPWAGLPGVSYPMAPGAPGHEVFGRIEAVGEGVQGLRVGEPVAAISYNGYAEYDVAPALAVVPIPLNIADRPVPGEAVACAVNVDRRMGITSADTVVVIGVGFLGALLIGLARRHAPGAVIALSRRQTGLDIAARMGADHVLPLDDAAIARVAELTDGRLADVVVEVTGRAEPLRLAAEMTRVRGRLVIAGYHQDGPRTIDLQLWNWRGLDVINAHERQLSVYRSGLEEALRLISEGEIDLDPLLTHSYELEEIEAAFQTAEARPAGFIKAIVEVER